jgi:hypothetical protein
MGDYIIFTYGHLNVAVPFVAKTVLFGLNYLGTFAIN